MNRNSFIFRWTNIWADIPIFLIAVSTLIKLKYVQTQIDSLQ